MFVIQAAILAKCPCGHAPHRASVHLRVDSDVLEWFRAQGKGHLTRMNAVLRSYVAAQKHGPQR